MLRTAPPCAYRPYLTECAAFALKFDSQYVAWFNGRSNFACHALASTKSPTLQVVFATPAAIAGVQRSVLWRFTKL